jgi:hypothetical protein
MMRERPQGSFEAPFIAQNGDRSETPVIQAVSEASPGTGEPEQNDDQRRDQQPIAIFCRVKRPGCGGTRG